MFKAAYKNLLSHKLRMSLTAMAIILGVGFISGTYFFTDTLKRTFDTLFDDVYSSIDITVRPASGDLGPASGGFDQSALETIKSTAGVKIAEPAVNGYAQFIDQAGELIGGQGPPTLGFSWTDNKDVNSLQIHEGDGRGPVAPGEVVMDKFTADQHNFKVGDTVKVITQGGVEEFKLVGIATFGDAESLAGATIAAFELSEAQRLFGYVGEYTLVDIVLEDGYDQNLVISELESKLPSGLEVVTSQQQVDESLDQFASGLGFINTALLTFAGVAVFVGAFIIQNTFRIIITQRSKELALMRALGAQRSQVMLMVVYEALLIGIVGSIVGFFAGLGIAKLIQVLMGAAGFGIPQGSLVFEHRTLIVSMVVGVGVTVLSALLPAWRASRLAPMAALQEVAAPLKRRALFKRGIIGLGMILLGGGAIFYGLYGDLEKPLYFVGMGVGLQFLGAAVIAPLVARPFSIGLGVIIAKLRGNFATLAYRNAARTPRRTATTAAALMIGISLIVFVSVFATSLKGAIDDIMSESFVADITMKSRNSGDAGPGSAGFSPDVYRIVNDLPETDQVSALRYAFSGFEVENETNIFVLAGIEPATFEQAIAKLKPSKDAYQNLSLGKIMVRQDKLVELNKTIGDSIKITYAKTGEQNYEIVGSFEEPFDSDYLISNQDYLANFADDSLIFVGATYADGVNPDAAKEAISRAVTDKYPQLEVQDQSDLKQTANDQIDQVLGLMWGLLAMAVIIAVFGITNTLMLSISERTREIGLLRAIGASRNGVRTMIRYESIIIALFGAFLGILMGVFFAWAIVSALSSEGIDKMKVSYLQLLIYLVFAVLAGVLAAIWPARKAARMDILKAISYE